MNEESLVDKYRSIITKMLNKSNIHSNDMDDYKQVCFLSLIQASRRYDSGLSEFETYARLCIKNAIMKFKKHNVLTFPYLDVQQDESESIYNYLPDLNIFENDTLQLKLEGFENREIADILGVSKREVQRTIKTIIEKAKSYNED